MAIHIPTYGPQLMGPYIPIYGPKYTHIWPLTYAIYAAPSHCIDHESAIAGQLIRGMPHGRSLETYGTVQLNRPSLRKKIETERTNQ